MIIDFLIQTFFAVVFFLGITGIGLIITGVLNFKTKSVFLYLSVAFFLSLCSYIILAVPFLIYLPEKILTLQIFSILYFLISFIVLSYFYFKIPWKKTVAFFEKNWVVFIPALFVLIVFFLQIYQTALFDEWLHRPVVNHFVNNGGKFPFENPYNKDQNFNDTYHYGLYIPTATIQIFTKLETSEALDILKLSFAIASFFLMYGIVYQFSKKRIYSIFTGLFILLSSGLFFFLDMFFKNNFDIWDSSISYFRHPPLYLMAGITWINLILSVAFIWLMEQVFNKKALFDVKKILLFLLLLGGFYLISELFVVLIIILFIFAIALNFFKKKIGVKEILAISMILLLGLLGIIFLTGGVASQILGPEIFDVLKYRPFGQWGYPNSQEIVSASNFWNYFESYSLEMIMIILLPTYLIKKENRSNFLKMISKFPLVLLAIPVSALVPFFFSTSFGDINLAKIANLWTILLAIIFFYVIVKSNYKKNIIVIVVIFLLILSCIPILINNFGIQWKQNERYDNMRCRENNLCYLQEEVDILRRFEAKNPDPDKILLVEGESNKDIAKFVDETNSVLLSINGQDLSQDFFENNKVDFVFYGLEMRESLNDFSEKILWDNFEIYIAEGGTAILKRKD
jgi:hypothetical protein